MRKITTMVVSLVATFALVSVVGPAAGKAQGATKARAEAAVKCISASEFTALQISAIQQEVSDAALTCGDKVLGQYNDYQMKFGPAIIRSDRAMLAIFRRVLGARGATATEQFKTNLGSKAEFRRIHGHAAFCADVTRKLDTILPLVVPGTRKQDLARSYEVLKDFAANQTAIDFDWPIKACEIAVPDVLPLPNPLRPVEIVPEIPPEPAQ